MLQQKALEEFYEVPGMRLRRVEKLPENSEEQTKRHTILGIARGTDKTELSFLWARRVFKTSNRETYVEVTFATPITPIRRGQEPPVWVSPGLYQVLTKR